jgi:hypothetical protein
MFHFRRGESWLAYLGKLAPIVETLMELLWRRFIRCRRWRSAGFWMPLCGPQQAIDADDADLELRRDSLARHALRGDGL